MDAGNESDDTLYPGKETPPLANTNINENVFTREFMNWERTVERKVDPQRKMSYLEKYEELEEKLLEKLEEGLSYMDNFIAIQAIFPALERKTQNSKILKPFNFIIRQGAKIYIVMILIYLKRYLLRLAKLNKLIRILKTEFRIINRNFLTRNPNTTAYYNKCLQTLYTEKIKTIVELVGYSNDLLLNLSVIMKNFKLGRVMGKFVGFVSWIINIYRLCRDEGQDVKNETIIKDLQVRFGV